MVNFKKKVKYCTKCFRSKEKRQENPGEYIHRKMQIESDVNCWTGVR
jgi:hypothetical protein